MVKHKDALMNKQSTSSSNPEIYDIIVVGAGMVGSAIACALAIDKRGEHLRIAVVEASDKPATYNSEAYDPRVVALTQASRKLLHSLHAWDTIVLQRACPYTDMHVWDAEGTGSIHFDCLEVQQNQLGYIVENSLIASTLAQRMQNLQQIDLLCSARVSSFRKDGDSNPSLILEDGRELQASMIIAADGANSKLRELVNFRTREWDYGHNAIVTTVKTEQVHQHTAWQRFMETGPLAFLPLEDELMDYETGCHHSSIVWSCKPELADELMALDDEAFAKRLGEAFEHKLGNIEEVAKRFSFPLRQRHAVDYVKPGIALVGDAAHTIHPLAGQGVNLGFLDVTALRDEILRACERRIPLNDESILRRYQRNRKINNLGVMAAMEGFKRLFGTRNIGVRWARNEGMRKVDSVNTLKNIIVKQAMGL